MSYTLDRFAAESHRILAADSGLEGREQVRALLGEVCCDKAFVGTYLSDHVSTRQILYEDPELGFCRCDETRLQIGRACTTWSIFRKLATVVPPHTDHPYSAANFV